MRRPSRVNDSIVQHQTGALLVLFRIKKNIAATAVVVHVHEKKKYGFPAGAINIMYSLLQEDGVVARELDLVPKGAN